MKDEKDGYQEAKSNLQRQDLCCYAKTVLEDVEMKNVKIMSAKKGTGMTLFAVTMAYKMRQKFLRVLK